MKFDGESPGEKPKSKIFYTIGEVSDMLGIKDYVIRFWEKEFEELSPVVSQKGNRRKYRAEDMAIIERIRELLYVEKFTVRGAKKQLTQEMKQESKLEYKKIEEPVESLQDSLSFSSSSPPSSSKPIDPKRNSIEKELRKNLEKNNEVLQRLHRELSKILGLIQKL